MVKETKCLMEKTNAEKNPKPSKPPNSAHRVQATCRALACTTFHVLRQMSPEADLIDSTLLFILIKEECSCSSLSLHPLRVPCADALWKVVISFIHVPADL